MADRLRARIVARRRRGWALGHLRAWLAQTPQDRIAQPRRPIAADLACRDAKPLPKIVFHAQRPVGRLALTAFAWRHRFPSLRMYIGMLAVDGRLFRTLSGGEFQDSHYTAVWRQARLDALSPAEAASPLAARPYDLRHGAASLWLNAGVAPTEVARRLGHGVGVLLKVYANCIDGEADAYNARISAALGADRSSDILVAGVDAARAAAAPPAGQARDASLTEASGS